MAVVLHWYLPTNCDSRSDLTLGNAVGAGGSRGGEHTTARSPDIAYIGQIPRSAEQLGFRAALTPTSSSCEDAWILTAGLTQVTERLRFLVAFRPGLQSPTLAAQMAATYQRMSGDRLLLNVVTGGDDAEQRRFGDHLRQAARYAGTGEFLHIVRELWSGKSVDFHGEHYQVEDAQLYARPRWPDIYFGGSSAEAIEVAARRADVYLAWGEPPAQVAEKLERVRAAAASHGREPPRFGIRLHAIARDASAEAWAEADRLLAEMGPELIARAQASQRSSQSEGQRRMTALHDGGTDDRVVSPNLWAGIGLVRGRTSVCRLNSLFLL
jgi:alkanesulfonate monooxygenase